MNLKNIIYVLIVSLLSYYLGKCDNEDGHYNGLTFIITCIITLGFISIIIKL